MEYKTVILYYGGNSVISYASEIITMSWWVIRDSAGELCEAWS